MNGNLVRLAALHRGRPVLMLPRAAQDLALRIQRVDSEAFDRPNRFGAILRALSGRGANGVRMADGGAATDIDVGADSAPTQSRAAYAPLYLGDPEDRGFCWTLNQGVALMQADGPLTDRGEWYCGEYYAGYDTILAGMREASEDSRVNGFFVRVSSPGGPVAGGLPELAEWMRQNREAAGGKPIWVYADMACSAAYWIAASADRIIAPRVGLIGSIGAVIVHENHAGALAKAGIELTAIEFPEGKTAGAWWDALPPEAKVDLQSEIKQCALDFCSDLQAGRAPLTQEFLLGLKARVFMGHNDDSERSALALGLIDDISGEKAAFQALLDHISASRTPGITPAAAPGGRAAAIVTTETPMAAQAPANTKAKAVATAKLAVAQAQADLAAAKLAAAEADAKPADDKDETPADEAEDAADGGDDEAAEGEDTPSDKERKPDATLIAASAEAKAHPDLAFAAIQTGQTFAQFQASAAAAGQAASTPRRGGLHAFMAQAGGVGRKVGPDAATQDKRPRSARETYAKNLQAGLSSRKKA